MRKFVALIAEFFDELGYWFRHLAATRLTDEFTWDVEDPYLTEVTRVPND